MLSHESASAIQAASAACTPAQRYKTLISDYLAPKPANSFTLFARRKNSERALGQAIHRIRSIVI